MHISLSEQRKSLENKKLTKQIFETLDIFLCYFPLDTFFPDFVFGHIEYVLIFHF